MTRTFLQNSTGKPHFLIYIPFSLEKNYILILFGFFVMLFGYCRKKLARRLLFDRSASEEHEKCILTKLKQQCGGQFTSKMEGMVCDLGYLTYLSCRFISSQYQFQASFFFL